MTVTTQDLTREELNAGIAALVKRVAELEAERDVAMQMASQSAKDLVQVRAELDRRNAQNKALAGRDTDLSASNRRLTAHVRKLALANEDLQRRLDRKQQEPEPVPRSVLGRRIGNQL